MVCTSIGDSAQRSHKISRTPSNTKTVLEKSGFLSSPATGSTKGITKAWASSVGFKLGLAINKSANGSRPASLAICALVRRFNLNGK